MLKIRLTRIGKRNRPYYRIVVAEHTMPIKGKFIEICGSYDPINKKLVLKKEEILKWLGNGAKPSNTVAKLLLKEGMKHKSIVVMQYHKKKKTKGKKKREASVAPEIIAEKQQTVQESKDDTNKESENKENPIKEDSAVPNVKKK